ncbi:MAG: hypothetical protein MI755_01130 [Sphingomonadales bacterium]|nr:hypothetical protein [Sphingomonadales bacterium]
MTRAVNMTMSDEGLAHASNLMNKLNVRTRSQAVETALSLSDTLVDAMKAGQEVVLIDADGKQTKIIIPGVSS